MSHPPPPTSLHPALPFDFPEIISLQDLTFAHDPLTNVAFGPLRNTEARVNRRLGTLFNVYDRNGGSENWITKAVLLPDTAEKERKGKGKVFLRPRGKKRKEEEREVEGEKIVGAAMWMVVRRESNGEADGNAEGEEGSEVVNAPEITHEPTSETATEDGFEVLHHKSKGLVGDGKGDWPEGACVQLCREVFDESERVMLEKIDRKDYVQLEMLFVIPEYQNMGIGTQLLEDGIRKIEGLGLQCVLKATEKGRPRYRQFGFEDVGNIKFDLEKCERGAGKGDVEIWIMKRSGRKEC